MERNAADMEGQLQAVRNEMRGMKTALVEMKDVLVKVEDKIEENPRKRRRTASGDKENIIVAGGDGVDSVEMFNWRQKTWSLLQSMQKKRWGATSFVHNNHVTIAGGRCPAGYIDDMIRLNINPNVVLPMRWSSCPVKLPSELANYSSVLYNDYLIVTGGYSGGDAPSNHIYKVQLVSPYAVRTLSRMPEPRQYNSTQLFDDNLLIVGGKKTIHNEDNLSSNVVRYDINTMERNELAPLPYEVSMMATVRWGDHIVVMGGCDIDGNDLNTVIMYNVKTQEHRMLPPMSCTRSGCTAVVIENNIVVLGGSSGRERLKSVEAFNFKSYAWEKLPKMFRKRRLATAVVV